MIQREENEQQQSVFKYCNRLVAIGRWVTSQRGRILFACNYNSGYCQMPRDATDPMIPRTIQPDDHGIFRIDFRPETLDAAASRG
ncbi:hypothetical protein AVEN_46439-1 [Araneus ventricosus]|uniref:Uncharacterized protein n=1 Tax=Araneus ventricosus TaxID=182803 RepID=A0A4Y2BP51_ARAVE|nr:hypothetical protein AVEN_149267-1 [Araneus ventricosus]GBL93476.1 hypothetical protein AVEN_198559-1 [Araneus ventricosus]GBO46987.1 hypothetical protein AVEN_46439-1 [Araneus ventricosus]